MITESAKTSTILVVEDESIIGMEIQSRLEELGYQVPMVASTGKQAVKAAGELKPDLVMMDISLKGDMDGIEAAARIKDRYDIPIIYLTANTDSLTFERAKISEPFGYLLKPFEERLLPSTIEMALYKAATEKKLREHHLHLEEMAKEREKLITELKEALAKVKTLSGFLPICASCKKIRDDKGYWSQIESYIYEHSDAVFSHGICPDCAQKLYPDLDLYNDQEKPEVLTNKPGKDEK